MHPEQKKRWWTKIHNKAVVHTEVNGTCTAAIPPSAVKVIVPDLGKRPRSLKVYSGSGSQDLCTDNRSPITNASSVGLGTG